MCVWYVEIDLEYWWGIWKIGSRTTNWPSTILGGVHGSC